ncbi:MAG: hypothetical protein U1F43_01575 [Myxococcota bacterium]
MTTAHPSSVVAPAPFARTPRARAVRALGLALVAATALAACASAKRSDDSGGAAAEPAGLRFGWNAGDSFDVTYLADRKGTRVELETRGSVSPVGKDALRVHFEAVTLAEKDKKLVEAGKSHAFLDQWPDLIIDKKTGALKSIDAALDPAAKDIVEHRWGVWVALVGDDLALGHERSGHAEVEVGEGLLAPVKMQESHGADAEDAHRYVLTRTFEGDPIRKLWAAMLADSGAPKKEIDAVTVATREERLTVVTDPKTFRHTRVIEQSTFSVTSKAGKVERVDVHTDNDDWTLTWQ